MSAAEATRWDAPDFDGQPQKRLQPNTSSGAQSRLGPSVEELAQIESEARAEGFAAGKAEGLAAGEQEIRNLRHQLQLLINGFSKPLSDLDTEVAEALGELAVQIAGRLVQHHLEVHPEELAALAQTALSLVGDMRREAELRLNPADLNMLQAGGAQLDARLVADPTMKRGDVRVHTPTVRIDATLKARLESALNALRQSVEGGR
ncbi:FliH/SctL family protein [Pseudomarimonas arenosa]|uniref:Flagellar assembly protein FliH n=1 Tax=Pseudomarimonas arenosa TaxID=2774145 RepID=A0AAW3ZHK3_9GAMM|nr:FliH/SctL family protein [Pseudomarimonas arenosa]MBD8524739.1 flagellar assembly protein FliH [Pseudomarimonas arenosa]